MKTISKSDKRRLSYSFEEGEIIIKEEVKVVPYGYQRGRWESDIVGFSKEEIQKILDDLNGATA